MTDKGHDQFAAIALGAPRIENERMEEARPIAYETRYFPPASRAAESAAEPSYEEDLKRFQHQLAQLREQYRPYLSNQVPPPPLKRPRRELKSFQFRYHEQEDCQFSRILLGEGQWEKVQTPDFRGPTKEAGKWTGYYRTTFAHPPVQPGKRVFLVCKGVDYRATVYINDKCAGSHEGFFAPFSFDITDNLQELNTLVVQVDNDYPTLGVNGGKLDGDKIYAATGIGWDDPIEGWHHCPPGGGIYHEMYIEERAELHVHDIFVRPDPDHDAVEVWVDVVNTRDVLVEHFHIALDIMPRNFTGSGCAGMQFAVEYAGPGINYYRYRIALGEYRLWEPDKPYLYNVRAGIRQEQTLVDVQDRHFGMRTFRMDEASDPKGTLYLNNREIILRGANEMGHLQLCVMRGDYDQLMDDILIAKLGNLNYIRVTQRPVQEEIYDYFDMLGMMHQTDLPLFGFLRRNQFSEAVRQSAEMERIVRSHPSTVMVSFINEPTAANKPDKGRSKGHRHLFRDELEAFFIAARQAVYVENPDRVVKNVEGDYEPPTREGMPDFHSYTMWYTNHALPIGRLYKGYLPPLLPNWKAGCGEYGAEGLDNYEVMMSGYPKEWLPASEEAEWMPDRIYAAQTHGMHGDWFEEQRTIRGWIHESQRHQALATRLMTDALRRRSDVIVMTAIHLLIDAWPSGWMKSVVGVDRVPKPAYFAYQRSLEPIRVNLRGDRWTGYAGELIPVEAWVLNDRCEILEQALVRVTVRTDEKDLASYEQMVQAAGCNSTYTGTIAVRLPDVDDRDTVHVDACLYRANGELLNKERFSIGVFARAGRPFNAGTGDAGNTAAADSSVPAFTSPAACRRIVTMGEQAGSLCSALDVPAASYAVLEAAVDWSIEAAAGMTIVVSDGADYAENEERLQAFAAAGGRLVLLADASGQLPYAIGGRVYPVSGLQELQFAVINRMDGKLEQYRANDMAYLYNAATDSLDYVANSYIDDEMLEPIVFGYLKNWNHIKSKGPKRKLPLIGRCKIGEGEAILSVVEHRGRAGFNPALDRLLRTLMME